MFHLDKKRVVPSVVFLLLRRPLIEDLRRVEEGRSLLPLALVILVRLRVDLRRTSTSSEDNFGGEDVGSVGGKLGGLLGEDDVLYCNDLVI